MALSKIGNIGDIPPARRRGLFGRLGQELGLGAKLKLLGNTAADRGTALAKAEIEDALPTVPPGVEDQQRARAQAQQQAAAAAGARRPRYEQGYEGEQGYPEDGDGLNIGEDEAQAAIEGIEAAIGALGAVSGRRARVWRDTLGQMHSALSQGLVQAGCMPPRAGALRSRQAASPGLWLEQLGTGLGLTNLRWGNSDETVIIGDDARTPWRRIGERFNSKAAEIASRIGTGVSLYTLRPMGQQWNEGPLGSYVIVLEGANPGNGDLITFVTPSDGPSRVRSASRRSGGVDIIGLESGGLMDAEAGAYADSEWR